jgi:hypothetical protein
VQASRSKGQPEPSEASRRGLPTTVAPPVAAGCRTSGERGVWPCLWFRGPAVLWSLCMWMRCARAVPVQAPFLCNCSGPDAGKKDGGCAGGGRCLPLQTTGSQTANPQASLCLDVLVLDSLPKPSGSTERPVQPPSPDQDSKLVDPILDFKSLLPLVKISARDWTRSGADHSRINL